jgi:pSer/pThr/pTyr-binding forkhead associated (FHA) protein
MENAPKVSNMHAEIESDGCQLYVRDIGSSGQGSTNGTFVQGIRVRGAASLDLAEGIEISLGRDFKLIVRTEGD